MVVVGDIWPIGVLRIACCITPNAAPSCASSTEATVGDELAAFRFGKRQTDSRNVYVKRI